MSHNLPFDELEFATRAKNVLSQPHSTYPCPTNSARHKSGLGAFGDLDINRPTGPSDQEI